MSLPEYTVWFRGLPACPCLAEWYPVHEAELQRRGILAPGQQIQIFQLIGSASASANTHSAGGAGDDDQLSDEAVWVARQMGADAAWARVTGSFANNKHRHLVLTGCPHNGPARYQIDEVRAGGDGLVGSTPDPGPRPLSGRTWREGIAWAKQLQEEEMSPDDWERLDARLDRIDRKIDALREYVDERVRATSFKRDKELAAEIGKLINQHINKARPQA